MWNQFIKIIDLNGLHFRHLFRLPGDFWQSFSILLFEIMAEDLKDSEHSNELCRKRGQVEDDQRAAKAVQVLFTVVNVVHWFLVIKPRRLLEELHLLNLLLPRN
jgi:hypothetical protein